MLDPHRSGPLDPGSIPVQVDEQRVRELGLHRWEGRHLVLYTDLHEDQTRTLTGLFDQAVPQWCEYFRIPLERVKGWKVQACLIQARERFQQAGLFPAQLPPFLHGYTQGDRIWCYDQPSDYYRRHLLLHEGTHAFMLHFLGGSGPPWFFEGLAELLGTHRWEAGRLRLGIVPATRDEVPQWGRIKIIQDDLAANQGLLLTQIVQYSSSAHLQVKPYGWSWAAALFLDRHPACQQLFRDRLSHLQVPNPKFSEDLLAQLRERSRDSFDLAQQWQLFVFQLDYGYDVEREAIPPRTVQPLGREPVALELDAARGWQSSGLRLAAGQRITISASGRYEVAGDASRPGEAGERRERWPCEPGGVTLAYHRGRPVGRLLAAVAPERLEEGITPLVSPQDVGLQRTLDVTTGGILLLRTNVPSGSLAASQGTLQVTVQASD